VLPLDSSCITSNPRYYAEHYTALLLLVLQAQVEEMERALILMVPLHLHLAADSTYRLHIPGIREDSPHLTIGDRLVLRGLYPDIKAPSSLAVEAEVVGLVKAQGWVYVRSPHLAAMDASLPRVFPKGQKNPPAAMYQIQFMVAAAPLCAMQDAVSLLLLSLMQSRFCRSALSVSRWINRGATSLGDGSSHTFTMSRVTASNRS
jgi:hypothetical protein